LLDLVDVSVGTSGRLLVDLGCGTGEVALPLSSAFEAVTAVDVDPAMIEIGMQKAVQQGIVNVRWTVGRAESLLVEDGTVDLVVAGSSFHWMDRILLSARVHSWLTDTGVFAVLGGGSEVWDERAAWHTVAGGVIRKHLGERRGAGSQAYTVTGQHEEFLEGAGFVLESRRYMVDRCWTPDEIVGYLYSTSFANPTVLGERKTDFEADLREGLHEVSEELLSR
jgi:SAM-dependent methyltransferase